MKGDAVMEFFIPTANTRQEEANLYDGIKTFLGEIFQVDFSSRRIQSLRFVDQGAEHTAEVGRPFLSREEPVVAILREKRRPLYHVCTPSRGAMQGLSILIGAQSVVDVKEFEPQLAAKESRPTTSGQRTGGGAPGNLFQ
jgi:hypothetical protein